MRKFCLNKKNHASENLRHQEATPRFYYVKPIGCGRGLCCHSGPTSFEPAFNGGVESFVRCGWSGEDVYPTGDGSHTGYLNLNDEILKSWFAKTWTPCLLIGVHLRDPWNPGVSYFSVFHWVRVVYSFLLFYQFFFVKFLSFFFCFSGMDSILTPIRVNFPHAEVFPPKKAPSVDCLCSWDGGPTSQQLARLRHLPKSNDLGREGPGV